MEDTNAVDDVEEDCGDFDEYVDPAPVPYARRAETALKHADHWAPDSLAEEAAVAFGVTGVGWALLAIFEQLEQVQAAILRGQHD